MQGNFRLISKEELKKINKLLYFGFSSENFITSGSYEQCGNGIKRYHVAMLNCNTYKPMDMLQKIGERIKRVLDADEVYYLGTRIA